MLLQQQAHSRMAEDAHGIGPHWVITRCLLSPNPAVRVKSARFPAVFRVLCHQREDVCMLRPRDYAAHILALVWALFWTWFGLASGIAEGGDAKAVLLHTAAPGLIFLALVLIAFRWEHFGGRALVAIGVIVAVAYPMVFGGRIRIETVLMVLATMAIPPLLAGILLLHKVARHRMS
jgi:hypothetical protein